VREKVDQAVTVCAQAKFTLGCVDLDCSLHGGLECGAVHEVLAGAGHDMAATAFGLCLAMRALLRAGPGSLDQASMMWMRGDAGVAETGDVYGPGLLDLGINPDRVVLVQLRNEMDLLRAGLEAARCDGIGAVILEAAATRSSKIDLSVTRRLKLAAERSGVVIILIRAAKHVIATAAQTRWQAGLVPNTGNQTMLGKGPCFDMTLLRHRGGLDEKRWFVEWSREQRTFTAALPQPLAAVPVGRPLALLAA
jgi:protein ImuA